MRECMLTTVDNKFDPFTEFEKWLDYDRDHYNSFAYLGRVARTSDALSEKENAIAIEQAIDDIIKYDPFNIYKKVVKET